MDCDRLAQLIDAKHGVLIQLRELAQRQHVLAESGEPAELVSLLAVKQRLLDALGALEHQLAPFRQQDPQARRWPSPAERARCAAVSGECRGLLEEVLEWERRGVELMQTRRKSALSAVVSANEAASARSAYLAAAAEHQGLDLASDR